MQGLCESIAGYRQKARQALPPDIWHYLESGSGSGRTLRANETAFDRLPLVPRPLTDVRGGHTRVELFGQTLIHPFLLAPIAYQRLFHTDGEVGSAMAAEAQQATMFVSSLASQSLSDIAATNASLWFQLYWQSGRETTLRLLRKAEESGVRAIVFTVDAPIKQVTLALPAGVSAVNLERGPALPDITDGQSEVFDQWMAVAPQWKDLEWLRSQTRLPLLVKGLLHADDAVRAVDAGCEGLIVSNHGGRVLDGTPASLQALRQFRRRLGPSLPLLFDSGIRSGSDAFKAIGLGADAVLVGRPAIWGLVTAGALGVAHVLKLLRDELEMTMALMGCPDLASIRQNCESLSVEDDSQ